MAAAPDTIHVHLDKHRHGVICCGTCGLRKSVQFPTDPALAISDRITVTCRRCQARFHVQFDLRRGPRHALGLLGLLYEPGTPLPCARLTVTSLSPHGLGFTTAQPLDLRPEALYDIVVLLKELDGPFIIEELSIRWCEGTQGGAAFSPPDREPQGLELYLKAADEDQ